MGRLDSAGPAMPGMAGRPGRPRNTKNTRIRWAEIEFLPRHRIAGHGVIAFRPSGPDWPPFERFLLSSWSVASPQRPTSQSPICPTPPLDASQRRGLQPCATQMRPHAFMGVSGRPLIGLDPAARFGPCNVPYFRFSLSWENRESLEPWVLLKKSSRNTRLLSVGLPFGFPRRLPRFPRLPWQPSTSSVLLGVMPPPPSRLLFPRSALDWTGLDWAKIENGTLFFVPGRRKLPAKIPQCGTTQTWVGTTGRHSIH